MDPTTLNGRKEAKGQRPTLSHCVLTGAWASCLIRTCSIHHPTSSTKTGWQSTSLGAQCSLEHPGQYIQAILVLLEYWVWPLWLGTPPSHFLYTERCHHLWQNSVIFITLSLEHISAFQKAIERVSRCKTVSQPPEAVTDDQGRDLALIWVAF